MKTRTLFLILVAIGAPTAAALFWRSSFTEMRASAALEQRSQTYYCSMHPSYRSDKPGNCPVCDMKLVPLEEATQPSSGMAQSEDQAQSGAQTYYCPMHPSYRSDKPGNCPICNMKLIPLEESAGATGEVAGRGVVRLRPEQRQLIGVRTAVVERKPAHMTVRAAARVEADERKLSAVNLKVGGWVEELFVKSVGETVKAGDPLFSVWSPEIYEAEQTYALQHGTAAARSVAEQGHGDKSLAAARERLLHWDLTDEQIDWLDAGNEPKRLTTIHAKSSGVVTARNIVQGTYAEPGKNLLELADFSTLWIRANVYEHELAAIRPGVQAQVEIFSLQGEAFSGEVAYVYPTLAEATRTQSVRLEVKNEDGRLKPGMFGTAAIQVDLGEAISIADSAVLDTGTRQLVFVEKEEGRFEPREVHLGERGEGWVVVSSGLEPGETVVTSGTFLIDSESRLRAAVLGHTGGEMAGMEGMEGMQDGGGANVHHH